MGHDMSAGKATNRLRCAGQTGQTHQAMDSRSIGFVPLGMFVGAIVTVSCTTTTTVICPTGKANCPCRPADAAGGVCDGTLVCLPAENRCADLTGIDLATDAAPSSGDDQSSSQEDSSTSDDSTGLQQADDASEPDTAPAVDSSEPDNSSPPVDSGGGGSDSGGGGGSDSGGDGSEGGNPGGNLITNGDFSQGMNYWHVEQGSNKSGYPSAATPYLCVTLSNGPTYIVGWDPTLTGNPPLDLPQGATYTLSYKAWTTGMEVDVEAKVGMTGQPYTPDLDVANPKDSVQASQVFNHTFTMATTDSSAGIAFVFTGTTSNSGIDVCFDDVSLVQQ